MEEKLTISLTIKFSKHRDEFFLSTGEPFIYVFTNWEKYGAVQIRFTKGLTAQQLGGMI